MVPIGNAAASEDGVRRPRRRVGRAYGLGSEGLALIRPDGYLGLVADSADAAVLRAYLADTLRITQPSTV